MTSVQRGWLRQGSRWLAWLTMLALVTAILVQLRGDIEQSHAVLVLLLIVLGGSASGGRALGYILATLGFLLIDYFFQAPYGLLSVGKALDWVMLAAFLASAFVATELLARAKEEADTARARTAEVASLSRLGSATLKHARAEDGLHEAGSLIRSTLDARWCTIRQVNGPLRDTVWTSTAGAPDGASLARQMVIEAQIVDRAATGLDEHEVALAVAGGGVSIVSVDSYTGHDVIEAFGLPLYAEYRLVGLLIVGGDASASVVFDAARRRFMTTIAYYAALGLERVRLTQEAGEAHALREADRVKDEVLATVSHDLRTPLTTIKLLAQAAGLRGDPAASIIEEQADRLASMVTNVLDLSTIRAGSLHLEISLNTAEDVIAAATGQVQGRLLGRRIVTQFDLDERELIGRFDFVQTLRILGNLVDNALRYTPPGGVVEIDAGRDGPWLAIRILDTGPGVAEAERTRIFEAFYRPKSQVPDAGSAGLGLSIAQRLAEVQEGSITYEPRVSGGSIFTLRLPAVDWDPALMADV